MPFEASLKKYIYKYTNFLLKMVFKAEIRRKKSLVIMGILCACSLAAIIGVWYYAASGPSPQGFRDNVIVGLLPDESSGLVYIAEDKGYFTSNGLNLTVKEYPNGAAAIQAMNKGDINLTLSSEFPLVAAIMGGQDLLIAGSIDKYYGTAIVAHRDHGIITASDLKGKVVTVSKNSIGEFYLGRFLDLNGIRMQDVTLIDRPPDAFMTDMSGNASIDAVVTTPQNAYLLVSQAGTHYIMFPVQSDQATYKVLAGNHDWVTNNPRATAHILKALDEAAQFAVTNPGEAQAIVMKHVHMENGYIRSIWPEHQYSLTLDQSLILAMEDEARWMIRNNLTTTKTVPNFLDRLYPDGMASADPGAITIIPGSVQR